MCFSRWVRRRFLFFASTSHFEEGTEWHWCPHKVTRIEISVPFIHMRCLIVHYSKIWRVSGKQTTESCLARKILPALTIRVLNRQRFCFFLLHSVMHTGGGRRRGFSKQLIKIICSICAIAKACVFNLISHIYTEILAEGCGSNFWSSLPPSE